MLSSLFSLKLDSNLTSPNFFRRQAIFHKWKNTHKSSSYSMFQKVMNLFFFFQQLVSTVYTVETSFKHQSGRLP